MRKFNSLAEAEAALSPYIPAVSEMTGKDITLQRMQPLMDALGNPQDKLKIIHIAGTSGKTSTAYYVAAMLGAQGKKVGLTVSPYIDTITERLQINLQPLAENDFCESLAEFLEIIKQVDPEPTYLELIIAFAFWYFAKVGVDYVVIETGMGGLHDATNMAQLPNKVCVITDIGFDHMHILGHTLSEIAAQKAGIIHAGNQVFMYDQSPEVMDVIKRRVESEGAKLSVFKDQKSAELQQLPLFQQRNWSLAHQAYEYVRDRDVLPIVDLRTTLDLQIPGRMDEFRVGEKTIVMDGAHNEPKMRAFIESFQQRYPGVRPIILFSLKKGKEYEVVLPLLRQISDKLIVTTYKLSQDLPVKAIEPDILAEAAVRNGFVVDVIKNPIDAYQKLLQEPGECVVITGSFYLLTCIRPLIIKT